MLIPLRDENPTRSTPYINYALVAANALIFIYELTLSPKAQAALRALKAAFGQEPVLLREGGSIPIVTDFKMKMVLLMVEFDRHMLSVSVLHNVIQ